MVSQDTFSEFVEEIPSCGAEAAYSLLHEFQRSLVGLYFAVEVSGSLFRLVRLLYFTHKYEILRNEGNLLLVECS